MVTKYVMIKLFYLSMKNQNDARKPLVSAHQQDEAGFSLVEMIAVVVIIGALAVIALPSWLAFVNRQQLNKVNDAILTAVQNARQTAQKTKQNTSVSFGMQNNLPSYIIQTEVTNSATIPSYSSKWKNLGEESGFRPDKISIYTNITAANTRNSTGNIDTAQAGTGKITFDFMGNLAQTSSGNDPTLPLKVMVARPQGASNQAGRVRRCVIIDTLLGGIRTAKDADCS